MKKLLIALLVLFSFGANAQVFTPIHNYQAPDGFAMIKYFGIPYGPDPTLNGITRTVPGAVYFSTTDSSMYSWTGTQWTRASSSISGTGLDSTSYRNFTLCFYFHEQEPQCFPFNRFICYTQKNYNRTKDIAYNCNDVAVDSSEIDFKYLDADDAYISAEYTGPNDDTIKIRGKGWGIQNVLDTSSELNKNNTINGNGNDFDWISFNGWHVETSNNVDISSSGAGNRGSLHVTPFSSNLSSAPPGGTSGASLTTQVPIYPLFVPAVRAFAYDFLTNNYSEFTMLPTHFELHENRGTGFINHAKLKLTDADTVTTTTNVLVLDADTVKRIPVTDLATIIAAAGANFKYGETPTGSSSPTITLDNAYLSGTIRLWKNGVRITRFTEATSTTITLTDARVSGDDFIIDYNY